MSAQSDLGLPRFARSDATCVGVALAAAYAFKRFCAQASASELDFLLRPTAALVHAFTGHAFVPESGAGYFSRELLLVIAPACAGHNFVVVLFTALVLVFVGRFRAIRKKVAWVALSAALAFVAGILTNSMRIALALVLREHQVFSGSEAHRVLGVGVYLGALLIIFSGTFSALGEHRAKLAVPLGVYVTVTLVVPLLGGAHAEGAFWHHAAVVLGASSLTAAVVWLGHSDAVSFRRSKKGGNGAALPRGVGGARRHPERSLPGEGAAILVPPAVD